MSPIALWYLRRCRSTGLVENPKDRGMGQPTRPQSREAHLLSPSSITHHLPKLVAMPSNGLSCASHIPAQSEKLTVSLSGPARSFSPSNHSDRPAFVRRFFWGHGQHSRHLGRSSELHSTAVPAWDASKRRWTLDDEGQRIPYFKTRDKPHLSAHHAINAVFCYPVITSHITDRAAVGVIHGVCNALERWEEKRGRRPRLRTRAGTICASSPRVLSD